MIPKIINYIWLSNEKPNALAVNCLQSWQRIAPDYEIKKWSMKDFNFEKMPQFVNDAIQEKKWAFACDYLRLYVLYNTGGLYLDSDVIMLESPDKFLDNRFFSAVEHLPECGEDKFQAAIMGSEPGHPFVKELMEVYERTSFFDSEAKKSGGDIAPHIYARKADEYGFVRENKEQQLREGMVIYKSEIFAPILSRATKESCMIHLCNGSWRNISRLQRIKLSILKYNSLHRIRRMKRG